MHANCRAYANYLFLSIIGTSTLYVVLNTAGRGEKEQWGPIIADETDKHDESEHCHSSIIYKTNMDITLYLFSRTSLQNPETTKSWIGRYARGEEAENEAQNQAVH